MRLFKAIASAALMLTASVCAAGNPVIINIDKTYGIKPGNGKSVTAKMGKALNDIRQKYNGRNVKIVLAPGRYDFYPDKSANRTYFISNHDQDNPKNVGMPIEGIDSLEIEGNGADLIFHGRMLPISVINSRGVKINNLHIDFAEPHITQLTILSNDPQKGITFSVPEWARTRIADDTRLELYGDGWSVKPGGGIPFEGDTKRVVYGTGDISVPLDSVVRIDRQTYLAPRWRSKTIKPGMVVTARSWGRPTPGIFLSECTNPTLNGVSVHYAEGMGLLAQLCDSVTLTGFNVSLRGDNDPRYFTTQADATHFSGCKGKITSTGGLYEGMMDDAINIHGTYLKVVGREDDKTLLGQYMHGQSYGFKWGEPGDSVNFINSSTMELLGSTNHIAAISPVDKETDLGAKVFRITFTEAVPAEINADKTFGIENLSWTPEVLFADNIIRNNRARGSLFSTPRTTIVERNLFDHTSGTAILLCGDCNGWFETGACRDVVIRDNRFINALTSLYQFTAAVISIYPEIPDLEGQTTPFHGGKGYPGVVIENNEFQMFDAPLLYAKSIDGLVFRNNRISFNKDYPPFHYNKYNIRLEHTRNVTVENNTTPLSTHID